METKNPNILSKQMMRYTGMTPAQLLSAILLCNEESKVALWYLLSERFVEKLKICYNTCKADEAVDGFKTFDDYLHDFYIYLYAGHPEYVTGPTEFHYLRTITDNTKVEAWLKKSFSQFVSNERRALKKLVEALPAYFVEQQYEHLNEPTIELTRIAFSLAWYNQFETVQNRYIFFRSMKKKVVKSFNSRDELSDEETAQALGMKYTTFRSQASRCCKEVQRLMTEMKHEDIAKLDANSLMLVDRISHVDENTLESIVDGLMTSAERQLPLYENLLEARLRKEEEHVSYSIEPSGEIPKMFEFQLNKRASVLRDAEIAEDRGSTSSGGFLEKIFKPSKKSYRSVCKEEVHEERKKSFVETFVENFKAFIAA